MDDRELLEMAAKAYGLEGYIHEWIDGPEFIVPGENPVAFNPFRDDGDALRLAVNLSIPFHVFYEGGSVVAYGKKTKHHPEGLDTQELFTSDPCKATRRAIVRAAAEIGKSADIFPSADDIRENWYG